MNCGCRKPLGEVTRKTLDLYKNNANPLEHLLLLAAEIDNLKAKVGDISEELQDFSVEDNSIGHEKLKIRAVGTENLIDGCITTKKIDETAISNIAYMAAEEVLKKIK